MASRLSLTLSRSGLRIYFYESSCNQGGERTEQAGNCPPRQGFIEYACLSIVSISKNRGDVYVEENTRISEQPLSDAPFELGQEKEAMIVSRTWKPDFPDPRSTKNSTFRGRVRPRTMDVISQKNGKFRIHQRIMDDTIGCLLYTSPSPRDKRQSRMPSSA